MGCRLWGHRESDTTEVTWHSVAYVYIYVCIYIYMRIIINEFKRKRWKERVLLFGVSIIKIDTDVLK